MSEVTPLSDRQELYVRKDGFMDWAAKIVDNDPNAVQRTAYGFGVTRSGAIKNAIKEWERRKRGWKLVR